MDKRRYQRLPREVTVDITYVDPVSKECREVERSCSRNLSAVGLLVVSDKKLDLGSAVDLQFYLPDSPERLALKAKVVRIEELVEGEIFDLGLEFLEIDDVTLAKINAFVMHESEE